MQIFEVANFGGVPLRTEFKAPYMPHALVIQDVVSFNLLDFCQKVYARFKDHEELSFSQEVIFAKLVVLSQSSKQIGNARKAALSLLYFTRASYIPSFVVDSMFGGLADLGFELNVSLREPNKHIYYMLFYSCFTNKETGGFESMLCAKALRSMSRSNGAYLYCKENRLFDYDEVFLTCFEFITNHLFSADYKDKYVEIKALARWLSVNVTIKSKSLLYFLMHFTDSLDLKINLFNQYLKAPEYGTNEFWVILAYEDMLDSLIQYSKFDMYISVFELYSKLPNVHANSIEIYRDALTWLKEAEPQQDEKKPHIFSPHNCPIQQLPDVPTALLIYLIAILESRDERAGLKLSHDRLKYLFPFEEKSLDVLAKLLKNKCILIESEYFDNIHDQKIDYWDSYWNAPFTLNISGLIGDIPAIRMILKEELFRRSDFATVGVTIWHALARTYFFSSFHHHMNTVTDNWIQKYKLDEEFEKRVHASACSAKKLSYVGYSAVKNTSAFHQMKSHGIKHTHAVLNLNLNKYLDYAETSSTDYSLPRHQSTPVFKIEQLMEEFYGIDPFDLYNFEPSHNALMHASDY